MGAMLKLDKPLSEGALAEVTEAMRLLNAAERRIEAAQGALQHCCVPFDVQAFEQVKISLDAAYANLCHIPLAHFDAQDALKVRVA